MKKFFRKFVPALLALCLITACIPVSAYAASEQLDLNIIPSKVWTYLNDDEVSVTLELKGIPAVGISEPNDVVLIIDRSGSMSGDMDNMRNAAKNFINSLDLNTHRVGIVSYDDTVESISITDDKKLLCDYIDTLTARGGTYIERGIQEAQRLLNNKRSGVQGSMVLMTDGETVNQNAAVSAAEAAKNNGNFFYTVALCQSESSTANINLKKMATSEADHYSVFYSSGLGSVYNKIAKKIGKCNPKDLVITQTINNSFEYVPGSADNNIPVPTVRGNTLTWTMNQLGEGTSTLSYKVRARSGATVCKTPISSGNVIYTDYNGSTVSVDFPVRNLDVKYNPPEITSIDGTDGKTAGGSTICVHGKYFRQGADVKINNVSMALTSVTDTEIRFVMPYGIAKDSTLTVYNPDGQWDHTYLEVFQTPVISKISPIHGDERKERSVTIYGSGFDGDKDDVKVYVGGKEATVKSVYPQNINIYTPKDLESGVYDIVVVNANGASATLPAAYTADAVYMPDSRPITSAVPGDGIVTLTWETAQGAELYRVHIFDEAGNDIRQYLSTTGSAVIKSLKNGAKYGFGVETYARNEWSGTPAISIYATPVSPIPPIPEKAEITGVTASGTTATVTWKPVEGATLYKVYAFPNKSGTPKTMLSKSNTVSIKKLNSKTEYGFWVEPYSPKTDWAGTPDPKNAVFYCYTMP